MMGIALGGLGVISLRLPFSISPSIAHLVDLPTVLLATLLVAVLAVVAYFTNPSEASFRTYLTELAFRQHLSRLSEAQGADPDEEYDVAAPHNSTRTPNYKGPRKKLVPPDAHATDTPILFHFANKAAVSLRTPGYHFRSFAVLTFAVVSPVEMTIASVPPGIKPALAWSNPATRGAWVVGAFGKWWLGPEIGVHRRQVRLATHDDNDLRDRAIGRARHDDTDPASSARHTEDGLASHKGTKPAALRRASNTAPPRTKAALRERLSLQTTAHKREPHAPPRPTTPPPLPKSASLPLHAKQRVPPPQPLPLAAAPSTQDLSPIIADILKQLDAARGATTDLRTQLGDVHGASARAQEGLQAEVDTARATKKLEDAGRAEVKARTKFLDDARRQADGSKREAEKRYKAAEAARSGAAGRIERLGREVEELQRRMVHDTQRVVESATQTDAERAAIGEALAAKREEIKVAEDVVAALTARARDLEGTITEETDRLQKLKERRQQTATPPDTSSWPPPLRHGSDRPPEFTRAPPSPRPQPLALTGISTLNGNGTGNGHVYAPPSQFCPFADPPTTPAFTAPLSPSAAALIPIRIMQSMESPRSADLPHPNPHALAFFGPSPNPAPADSPSPIDEPPGYINRFDAQRALHSAPAVPIVHIDEEQPLLPAATMKPRRWFSASAHAKEKGLNPDAKEFTLSRGRALHSTPSPPTPSFASGGDPLLESPPRLSVAGSFFSSLHNAFAPSPAEREALQRALGSGSGNASLERVAGASLERVSSRSSGSGSGGGSGSGSPPVAPLRQAVFNPWPTAE